MYIERWLHITFDFLRLWPCLKPDVRMASAISVDASDRQFHENSYRRLPSGSTIITAFLSRLKSQCWSKELLCPHRDSRVWRTRFV